MQEYNYTLVGEHNCKSQRFYGSEETEIVSRVSTYYRRGLDWYQDLLTSYNL
jgi:hypothetical protein